MTNSASNALVRLHSADNVAVSCRHLVVGEEIDLNDTIIHLVEDIPVGHKVALRRIGSGCKIVKYGASIGSATANIEPGHHVHLHNMKSDYIASHTRTTVKHSGEHL